MEKKEVNKVDEENKNHVYKNICYEMDTNKLMINDSENNQYLCDVFGRKKIKFLPNITGSINRYKYPVNNTSFFQSTNFFPIRNNTTNNSNLNRLNNTLNKKQINYFPTTRKFEGYSKFPRPIGPPFINIPDYDIREKNKRKIIDHLNDYFEDFSAKNDIIRKNENKGISFLTGDLNECDLIKHDTEQSLKLISNTLNNYREEYKLKLNIMHKDPNVKALNQFKKNLLLNRHANIINGRILGEPCDKIKKNYRIIQSLVNRTGLSFDKKRDRELNNIFNKIKYSRKNKTVSKCDDDINFDTKNISIITSHNRLNDLHRTKDFTIGRLINMDFGFSSDKKNKTNNNLTSNDNQKLPDISKKETITNRNNESIKIEDAYKETEETVCNDSTMNIKANDMTTVKKKSLDEKINDNELSFISYMSDNEIKYAKQNNKTIKSIKTIKKNGEHYNKLLVGYQEKERMPQTVFPKSRTLKLKSNGDLYRENMNLLRLTNREAFRIQEQKELYDLKMLEKKIKISAVNAHNVMKGKQLKTNEDNNTKEN